MSKFFNILLVGRSGCGKGTQAKLLKKFFEKRGEKALYIYTGDGLRELAGQDNFTGKLLKEKILEKGGKAPDFLAVFIWTKALIEKFSSQETHLIFDGSPRTKIEAMILDDAFGFYERGQARPILIDILRKEAFSRLKGRARFDDSDEAINHRLDYYEKYVVPAIEYYKKESPNKLHIIDGNPHDINKIHQDILKALELE